MHLCPTCAGGFGTISALHRHQARNPQCLEGRRQQRDAIFTELRAQLNTADSPGHLHSEAAPAFVGPAAISDDAPIDETIMAEGGAMDVDTPSNNNNDAMARDAGPEEEAVGDQDACRPRVTMEEIPDDGEVWVEEFPLFTPDGPNAGAPRAQSKTAFEVIRDDQILQGAEILGPFESEDEWQLAKWLIKNVGHNQAEAFLRLPIVRIRC